MTRFRIVLEYDGTDFEGWQAQREGRRTVQGVVEAALRAVTGAASVRIVGAGRTDAGVHAEGQVASVALETRLDPATLRRALDAVLPRDVAARDVACVPESFHARRDAVAKLYAYRIWNAPARSPLRARRSFWVPHALDRAAMRRAAETLRGTHDFASFEGAGSKPGPTVRSLDRVELVESGPELRFELEGRSFLRHMVRNVVGTLLEVGRGRRAPDSIAAVLAARSRAAAGPTAPAHGLTLVHVRYVDFPPQSGGLEANRVDGPEPRG